MQALTVTYFKRYRMEIDLDSLPRGSFPEGYRCLEWHPDLLGVHAEILAGCFQGEMDSILFPNLGNANGCLGLMNEIIRRRTFLPEATWLLEGPNGPCGTIQTLRERGAIAAIQNIGILPNSRGHGLGRVLLVQALDGMLRVGMARAMLEVTSTNGPAVGLYRRLGFRRTKVLYKAVPPTPSSYGGEEIHHFQYI